MSFTGSSQQHELPEDFYRLFAQCSYDWETWVAPDGRYLYCSPSAATITGYSAEDFLRDPNLKLKLIHPEDRAAFLAHRDREQQPAGIEALDFRLLRRDGSVIWISHACQAVFSADGEFLGRRGTNRDITRQKQVEAELARSQQDAQARAEELAGVLSAMRDAVVVYDREGTVVGANRELLDEAGDDLIGRSYRDNFAARSLRWPNGTPLRLEDMAAHRALQGEYVNNEEMMRLTPEGEERSMLTSAAPLLRDGAVVGAVAHWRDTTDLRRAQQEREQLLARVQAERERLFAVLSVFPAYVCVLTEQHEVTFANKRFTDWFGQPQPGQKCYDLLFGRTAPCDNCLSFHCLREDQPQVWEWIAPDGRFFDVYDYPFAEADGSRAVLEVGFDVTVRKHAQAEVERLLEQVKAERQRLFAVLDTMPGYVCLIGTDHRYAYVSRRFTELFGAPDEGQRCYELVMGYDRPCDNCRAFEPLADGNAVSYEWHKPSGETLAITNSRFVDTDGSVYSLETGLDITARKQAEQELERHTRVFAAITHILQETVRADSEQQVGNACLRVAEAITGSRFGFVGELNEDGLLHDIAISDPGWEQCGIPPEADRRLPGHFPLRGLYGRVLIDSVTVAANDPAAHPDSRGLPPDHPPLTAFLGTPLRYDGRTVGVVAVGNKPGGYTPEDRQSLETLAPAIIEALYRKRAELQLQRHRDHLEHLVGARTRSLAESEAKYRQLVESANSAIIRWSTDGAIEFANEYAERLFGYGPGELIGQYVGCLLPPQEQDGLAPAELIGAITSDPQAMASNENANITRDGRILWVSWANRVITGEHGELQAILAIGTDRTVQHEAEQQLQVYQERLRQLTAELVLVEQRERLQLATWLHDEVAQPLGAIKIHLSMIRDKHPQVADDTAALVAIANDATVQTRSIMTELSPPVLQRLGLVEAVRWWAETLLERHGLPVKVATAGSALQLESVLQAALFQAIKELLQNVVKHGRATEARVALQCNGSDLTVRVEDDGVGFDPARVETTPEGGFGLFSIRERINYLGGSITISSEPGKGTAITLELPGVCSGGRGGHGEPDRAV